MMFLSPGQGQPSRDSKTKPHTMRPPVIRIFILLNKFSIARNPNQSPLRPIPNVGNIV